ncbi:MAG: histidine kinase [Cyclobacteriaceae bacterium]|nr:histidine kinase [Cyclobacteriaceae bacterium]
MMSPRLRNHLLFWSAYVFFKAFLNLSGETALTAALAQSLLLTQLCFLLVKVPMVYGSFYFTDRYLEGRWKMGRVLLALTAAFSLGSYAMFMVNRLVVLPLIWHTQPTPSLFSMASMVYHFFTLLFVVGVALSIRLFRKQYRMEIRRSQLEKEKTEAELKYLKSQINPHFLFNTLNNIYALARKGSGQTAESVMKLSAMMRFMLYEASSPSVPLRAEIKIIDDYIELEKLRYTDRLQVHFSKDIDDPEQPIAPLLLIHFVENAFKHGAGESRSDVDIRIAITLKDRLLRAEFSNPLSQDRVSPDPGGRIGMENIKQQLKLLYPGHTLAIETTGGRFSVVLTIPLGHA